MLQVLFTKTDRHLSVHIHDKYLLYTVAQIQGRVLFAEANDISIGPKAVRLHELVLPDC